MRYFFKSKRNFCPEYYEKNNKLLNEYYTLALMKARSCQSQGTGLPRRYSLRSRLGYRAGPSSLGCFAAWLDGVVCKDDQADVWHEGRLLVVFLGGRAADDRRSLG